MQQASRQVAFRALGPNVQRSVLVVQLGEAPQMLHTLVVVAVVVVVVVVGIKLQMNSRHVISCLTASLQLSAMGHLLSGLAWLWLGLAWPASSFGATQLREGSERVLQHILWPTIGPVKEL